MAKNLNLNLDLKKVNLKQLAGSLKSINLTGLKKYSSLFPSIGLLLVAGLILILTLLTGGSVNKKMSESARISSEIQSKISQPISEAAVAVEEEYHKKFADDAAKVEAMAIKTSMRELICYNPVIFPKPVDRSTQVYNRYGSQYRVAIENLIEKIRAKDAPSAAEISSRTGHTNVTPGAYFPQPTGTTGPQSAMVDAFCLQRADEIPVYASPEIFSWYGFWEKYTYASQEQALKDCWYSQVAYWVYEDVIQTIEELNADSVKVSQSPVKRLLGVRFDGPVQISSPSMIGGYEYGGMGPMTTGPATMPGQQGFQDNPVYVKGQSIYMPVPWTGRMSNDDIDIIHFALSVVVDAKSATAFMKELCSAKSHTYRDKFEAEGKEETASHNQITILQLHMEPVVRDNVIHANYRYGKDAVVQLNLICEYFFIRKAYDMIKPDPVKGTATEQNPTPAPPPVDMGM